MNLKLEVQLKKSKITKSILSQTIGLLKSKMSESEAKGWCYYKERKYIVLQNLNTYQLSKFPYFSRIEEVEDSFDVVLHYNANHEPYQYYCKTQEDKVELLLNLKSIIEEADKQGQFYI